ncbi:histidine kinase [Prevotella sp. HMSC077E09]|uniref:sensor histidine kinase n=1 Tax=Prevotella sp. HMSC077E09 TaxID=1739487 RepID=UPI0008A18293|nr:MULTISPECIES: HAMP domain-containing sensor histidine kinase [unclassified Prevotella]OFO71685.1 histidine kinase [Prevotella sp. HMSC077E08]OFP54810.1 histidine kinase [Prevotella sp. HMSC077E09]
MKWTDRLHNIRLLFIMVAVLIAFASVVVSHLLISDLAKEEATRMEVWAEAMRSLNAADEHTDLALVLKVINENHTIPVIVINRQGHVQTYRNVKLQGKNQADSIKDAVAQAQRMRTDGHVIRIMLDNRNDYIDVCYAESLLLRRLSWYPYVQLGVILLFAGLAVFALLTLKRAEQNHVWVGLSKETAHQLGTPISSLMAWMEIMKEAYPDDKLLSEMDNDVKRLQLIADRFSKIGSQPTPEQADLIAVLQRVVAYMDSRTSRTVVIMLHASAEKVMLNLNVSLFEWVIENLCKNAVDALEGRSGRIDIYVMQKEQTVVIDLVDTGKGIRQKDMKNVFRPGFTTKQRGWGLGLSLARRIVEEYHHGKIFVKQSEVGQGTTFRIILPEL